ncbi:transposase [Candidatus Reidiella endopervernicosa]|uniref:Transposase n=1 Tax=Candidatus Reidiella endopervernicosa TaxID=2738883 RepID=A0A6N0I0G0_9GAMM|nr:transposase [Candidatus Reidiella endopervernicosa]
MRHSVNRPGYCTDNGHMESFFHTLKAELIRGSHFDHDVKLRFALNSYINQFYNHRSRESLFLRKFVLGIQAQANSKNVTRPFMPAAPDRPAYVA